MSHAIRFINREFLYSLGTFGFWTAFLPRGDVILAGPNVAKEPYELHEPLSRHLPHWVQLEDGCFANGELVAKCKTDLERYGVELVERSDKESYGDDDGGDDDDDE